MRRALISLVGTEMQIRATVNGRVRHIILGKSSKIDNINYWEECWGENTFMAGEYKM